MGKNFYLFMVVWCTAWMLWSIYCIITAHSIGSIIIQALCALLQVAIGLYFLKRYRES